VVTVHDFGVYDDDRAYLVMELLDGRSLREELRERGRLEPKRAMENLRGVAAATALPGRGGGEQCLACRWKVAHGPGNEIEEEAEMPENPFVGAWALVSFEVRSASGAITYPFGHDVRGYIVYSHDGYMSVAFMQAGRAKCKSEDVRGASAEEKVSAMDTYLSYCGRYEVRGDKVVHHIEVSLFPNWIGQDQERLFRLEGDQLTLSTPPMPIGGQEQTAHLIWKRSLAV